jgi:iron complex transport system substrate-binding protein
MKLTHLFPVLGIALAAASPAGAFELQHAQGSLALAETPQRVVSYELAHLDTLNTLGIPVAGVPKSVYSGALSKYSQATVVGTLFEPDYDQLKGVKPDLIIAGGRSASDPSRFLESVKTSSLAIGRAWGKEAQAQAALDDIQKNVDTLHDLNRGKKGALLFVVRDNVIAHAPGERFGYVHELTGLAPVLPPKQAAAPAARPEPGSPEAQAAAAERAKAVQAVAEADPDWLIVLDRGAINDGEKTAANTLAKHPQISQTAAFREGRVYYVDPNGWYVIGAGLTNLKTITGQMITAMK